jgi:hypothetical protein
MRHVLSYLETIHRARESENAMKNEEIEIMEMVSFALASGTDAVAVRARARDIDEWLAARPGFIRRTLVGPDAEGRYTDIVHWRTMTDANAAAELIMKEPSAGAFMALIDGPTVRLSHVPIVAATAR